MNRTRRILIVDDHPTNRRLPATLLRQHGWAVDIAADGESALDKLAVADFDAVLLDLNMPEVSGFEVCRRIRADELLAHLRVYAYTAMTTQDQMLQHAGFDDVLAKPLSTEKLLAVLNGRADAQIGSSAGTATDAGQSRPSSLIPHPSPGGRRERSAPRCAGSVMDGTS